MKKIFLSFTLLIPLILSTSCHKTESIKFNPGHGVEIYLLKEYNMIDGKCKIDDSTIIMENTALIFNEEIIYYKLSEHIIGITDGGIEKLKDIGDWDAFCVTVNKQLIYSGIFKPGYSSSTCDHSVTINPLSYNNEIHVYLGYPSATIASFDGVDPRENELLIQAFRSQGKLR